MVIGNMCFLYSFVILLFDVNDIFDVFLLFCCKIEKYGVNILVLDDVIYWLLFIIFCMNKFCMMMLSVLL